MLKRVEREMDDVTRERLLAVVEKLYDTMDSEGLANTCEQLMCVGMLMTCVAAWDHMKPVIFEDMMESLAKDYEPFYQATRY